MLQEGELNHDDVTSTQTNERKLSTQRQHCNALTECSVDILNIYVKPCALKVLMDVSDRM